MDEIKKKINENGILYDENAWLREKKLREVTNEYTKKYNQELIDLSNVQLSLSSIMSYIQAFYTKIDNEINNGQDTSWIFLGHYIIMIMDCTSMLKKCYD